ncbi:MAG: carbohydrate kinase [Ruthenibacterium lactatiformans]
MFDIVALGESLIDFTPSGENSQGMALFARNPGGAPANVLAMAAKLGGKTAFIGKVGDDAFGAFLKKTMEDAGVDVRGLRMTREYPTTLAFVQLTPEGNRSFTFYRKPGADVMLAPAEVDRALLRDCRIFHFGSVSLTDEPCRTATLEAAREAKAAGAMISYDPNYRPFLWDSAERARSAAGRAASGGYRESIGGRNGTADGRSAAGGGSGRAGVRGRGAGSGDAGRGARTTVLRQAGCCLPAKWTRWTLRARATLFWGALLVPCGQDAGRADIAAGTVGAHCRVCKRSGQPDHRGKGAIPAMPAREQILRLCGE